MRFKIRKIEPADNDAVAKIVRDVMTEMGAVGPGSSMEDPEVKAMFEAYQGPKAAYYVVEYRGKVLGGGGFGPLNEGPEDTCELRKMYFRSELRGHGAGVALLDTCTEAAREAGYTWCYLETRDSMRVARLLYGHHGFEVLPERLGNTGHTACGTFMRLRL